MQSYLARRLFGGENRVILRIARLALAWLLLNAPPGRRERWREQVGGNHVWSTLKGTLFGLPLNGLERRLMASADRLDGWNRMIVQSLFRYAYEYLDDGVDWADPTFLDRPYLSFMLFEYPLMFRSPEDHHRAVSHAERLIHGAGAAFDRADPARRDAIARAFSIAYNFNPAVFTTINLQPLASGVGRLLEHHLRASGCSLDHEFPAPRAGARRRIGVLVRNIERRTESFIAPAFVAGLDRGRFETVLITLAMPANRDFAGFVGGHFDRVEVIEDTDLGAQVEALRALELDLLFPANTMAPVAWVYNNLLAHRLARVQIVGTIVSPLTTGLSRTDFALTAPGTEPDGCQNQYSERVLLMEGMFNCFILGEQDPRTPRPRDPAAGHLPKVPIRFASGGSLYKLTPALRRAWLRILGAVPNSELLLYPFNPGWGLPHASDGIRRLLEAEFAAFGINRRRLRLMPNQTPAQLVELLRDTDVFLDTFPYSGAASFMEPIAARCPMLGLRGVTQRGLQGAAMLDALGLSELIASDVDDYVAKAIRLARSPGLRTALQRRIEARLDRLPFLAPEDFGRRLTVALDRALPPNDP
jgi:predicted O-linked N-acetylglucosamine transferase (SPINDLY family)